MLSGMVRAQERLGQMSIGQLAPSCALPAVDAVKRLRRSMIAWISLSYERLSNIG